MSAKLQWSPLDTARLIRSTTSSTWIDSRVAAGCVAAASLLILLVHARLTSYTAVATHEDHVLPAPTLRRKLKMHATDHGGFTILVHKLIRMFMTLVLAGLSLLPYLGGRSKNAALPSSILFAAEVRHQRLAMTQILADPYGYAGICGCLDLMRFVASCKLCMRCL